MKMTQSRDIENVCDYIKSHWKNTLKYTPKDEGTLLRLPYAYTVPCMKDKTFQSNFYWDTYFTNIGLLKHGLFEHAKNNTDNLLYEVEKYGFVPNGNRTFFLNRSQPPVLSLMVKDIFDTFQNYSWLKTAYEILSKEYTFWMEKRMTPVGLNRNYHHATEVELNDFYNDELEYRLSFSPESQEEKLKISSHYLAEAETGWDFTPRFNKRCADFIPIDLNCFLCVYEINAAYFCDVLNIGEKDLWLERAQHRKELLKSYCWNDEIGLFYDFDFVNRCQGNVASLATFTPLWANIATPDQAARIVANLPRFEFDFGVSACEKNQHLNMYQWDYPNGWPPLFYMVVNGLKNYRYFDEAKRIAEKYVRVVIKNFNETADLWEKYNVVDGSTKVNNEYEMPTMMGWTAAVFVSFADLLKENSNIS